MTGFRERGGEPPRAAYPSVSPMRPVSNAWVRPQDGATCQEFVTGLILWLPTNRVITMPRNLYANGGAISGFARQLAANECSVHAQKADTLDLAALACKLSANVQPSAIKPGDLPQYLIGDAVLRTLGRQPATWTMGNSASPSPSTAPSRPCGHSSISACTRGGSRTTRPG